MICKYCRDERPIMPSINCNSGRDHRICLECFWEDVKVQLQDGKFSSRGRKIICSQCYQEKVILPFVFYDDNLTMQLISSNNNGLLQLYKNTSDDAIRRAAERKAESEKQALAWL
jgi:hypothetical protein